jgi:chitosanase
VGSGTVNRREFVLAVLLVPTLTMCKAPAPSVSSASTAPVVNVNPATKEIILALVSTAENSDKNWKSSYAYIEDVGDGHGYTAGIVGWCSGTGDMLTLVERYTAIKPGNVLEKYIPRLRKVMVVPYGSRPGLSHALLGEAFISDWVTAAKEAPFQELQRAERERVYWNPAMAAAKDDGLSTLGQYIYYDISVNHGPGDSPESFGGIVARVKAHGHRPPDSGGDEVAYLSAIVAARDAVLRTWGVYQVDGRSSIALRFLTQKRLNLTVPLRWTVYGDSYSITTPPAP